MEVRNEAHLNENFECVIFWSHTASWHPQAWVSVRQQPVAGQLHDLPGRIIALAYILCIKILRELLKRIF